MNSRSIGKPPSLLTAAFVAGVLALTGCSKPVPEANYKVYNVKRPAEGKVRLAPGIEIDRVNSGYTLWLPDPGPATGLVVFFHARRDTASADFMIKTAVEAGLGVLYVTTDNFLEFFFDTSIMAAVEADIWQVLAAHQIPIDNLLYCGMSLEGVRALKMVMFAQSDVSRYNIQPKAIAICDAPLDMARFYRSCRRAVELDYHPAAANEGKWVSEYLFRNLGGAPADTMNAYTAYSPFTYEATDGGNAVHFQLIPLRAYTEPDVHWWMEHRGKDYYDMNSLDMAAMVNQLKLFGNGKAELITTTDKGYLPDGQRHPHSWSIVDEAELIEWFTGL